MRGLRSTGQALVAPVPQTQPLDARQVPNSAGGYSYPVDDWTQFRRFLTLGTEGGTYYASEPALSLQNAKVMQRLIEEQPEPAIDMLVRYSLSGRTYRQGPILFAFAYATAAQNPKARRKAERHLSDILRTGTHLFQFIAFREAFVKGTNKGLRQAFQRYFADQEPGQLAFQAVKYQQRDGWAFRDVLRLLHPKAETQQHNDVFHWITKGWEGIGEEPHPAGHLQLIWAMERAKRSTSAEEIAALILEYRLPREAVPTQFLNEAVVWRALLDARMPITAMIRNLATMTAKDVFKGKGRERYLSTVCETVLNLEQIRRGRVHPLQYLSALIVYAKGQGERGGQTWAPERKIVDALNDGYLLSFGGVEPTGKRRLIALDVSSSMEGTSIAGIPGLDARMGSTAMAQVTINTEPETITLAFTCAGNNFNREIHPFPMSQGERLDSLLQRSRALNFGGTDCALPMLYALEKNLQVDSFEIYTDSETWAGRVHPMAALQSYRRKMGIPAKLIVVGMAANSFSIADPSDAGAMDVVGFDTAAPAVMASFIRG